MRLTIIAIAIALGGISAPAVAHPEDEFTVPVRIPATVRAQEALSRMVAENELPASWADAKLIGRELRTKDGALQWVVIFQNDAERNRRKRMLYVLISPAGAFISADHELT
jgi:hypothetical protein